MPRNGLSVVESGAPEMLTAGAVDLGDLIPSQSEKGFFDDLADDDRNYVNGRKLIDDDTNPYGATQLEVFTMHNGRDYEVVTGRPKKQKSDMPVVFTTALGTSIQGHNEHTMRRMMALGYPVVMIGPEGGHQNWPTTLPGIFEFLRNLASIDLVETAENIHAILEVTDQYEFYEPGQIVTIGESRGASTAMGVGARAQKFGRKVLYADTTAPVFPNSWKDLTTPGKLSWQSAKQLGSIVRVPLKMNLRRAVHYPATINPNPFYLMHMVANVPTLLSGSAGELAREIDPDSKMHNTHFVADGWSFTDTWEEIFAGHPHVVNTRRPGTHMAIANEMTLKERETRLGGLRDEADTNHYDEGKMDWRNVHMGKLAVLAS